MIGLNFYTSLFFIKLTKKRFFMDLTRWFFNHESDYKNIIK